MQAYTTSEIAALTGVSIPTLRHYERIGLLDPVARASNGHRRYSAADLRRLDFLNLTKEIYRLAMQQGLGEADFSAIYAYLGNGAAQA